MCRAVLSDSVNLNTIADSARQMRELLDVLEKEVQRGRAERDEFAVHIFKSRKSYRQALEHDNKSGPEARLRAGEQLPPRNGTRV